MDAYLALSGSPLTHLALIITFFVQVEAPDDVRDDDVRSKLYDIYYLSIVAHTCSFMVMSLAQKDSFHMFKIMQISETVIVFTNVFLLLRSIEVFAMIQ